MVEEIINDLSVISPLLPIVVGVKKYKTLLWLYALAGLLFDITMLISDKNRNIPVNIDVIANTFLLIEFFLISTYFKGKILSNKIVFYVLFVFCFSIFVALLAIRSPLVLNNYGAAFFNLVYIGYSIAGFYFILKRQEVLFLGRSEFFWFCAAILLYFTGNFLIFLSDAYFQQTNAVLQMRVWVFHNILNIMFSIMIAVALLAKNE